MKTTENWSKVLLAGMAAMVLSFGLVLVGCDDGSGGGGGDPNTVATPTANPVAGEVASGTTVTLSTTTDGATIHYTINGSNPTTSSPTYSSPISITAAVTIKAIAVKSGMTDSGVLSASYTIGSGGGGKPAQLASGATYQQAVAKCDEIITYCNSHPGTMNDNIKTGTQSIKSSITAYGSGSWSYYQASVVSGLNNYIDTLQ